MSGRQYRHLTILIASAIILLSVAIVLLFVVLNKPRDIEIRNYVGINGKDGISITGPQGIPGLSIQGAPGVDGKTIINTVTNNISVPGEKGDTGATGAPSPQLLVKVDPVTCKLLSKYDGDDIWKILAQLPKPCTEESDE